MNILVFAGCNDKKLLSKIAPLLESELVNKVYLVREFPLDYRHIKLIQHPTPKILRSVMPLREVYRLTIGKYLVITKSIDTIIGIHFLMHGIYAYVLSLFFRKHYIQLIIENPKQYRLKKIFAQILNRAKAVGVRGNSSKLYLESLGVDGEKIFNPPNEFKMPDNNVLVEYEKKRYDVLFIGHFIDRKDIPLWIQVFKQVKEKFGTLRGVMLGEGPLMDEMKQLIAKVGLESDLDILGQLSNVNPIINNSRVLLMTSKSEGLPMVAVESMSYGVPVVSSDVGDTADLVKDNVNGYLIRSREPSDYSTKVAQLLKERELYNRFSEASLKFAQNLAKESTIDSLVLLWNKVLKDLK